MILVAGSPSARVRIGSAARGCAMGRRLPFWLVAAPAIGLLDDAGAWIGATLGTLPAVSRRRTRSGLSEVRRSRGGAADKVEPSRRRYGVRSSAYRI